MRERQITCEEIAEGRKRLEERFARQGYCWSCNWHGALYEHDVEDEDIAEALREEGGRLRLSCVNKDGCPGTRGVIVYIGPEEPA